MKIEVFKGDKRWYYHVKARNGKVLLVSESYFSKGNAKRAAKRLGKANNIEVVVA